MMIVSLEETEVDTVDDRTPIVRRQVSRPRRQSCMMAGMAARNNLDRDKIRDTEPTVMRKTKKKKKEVPEHLKGTRMAKGIRNGERPIPAIPKNKSLAEIREMDEDDPQFKVKPGQRRSTGNITAEQIRNGEVDWTAAARADRQKRFNGRRARARKGEAVVVKAVEVLSDDQRASKGDRRKGVYDEDKVIAEGILSLDDWDDEELIRGYRRTRSGRFGQAPAFIPREIQQELFRRIVARGDKKMRAAYLTSVEQLAELAHTGQSEKVKLEAIKELMNRVVGKVPDRVHVATEQPWEQFLADSIQPVGDEWTPEPMGEAMDLPALPGPVAGHDYGGKAPTEEQD